MKNRFFITVLMSVIIVFPSCEIVDNDEEKHIMDKHQSYISLSEVTQILTSIPITEKQVKEVYDAVTASSGNGYDEE